jgi:3-hydroxyisobutyrate dehydrogenase
VQRGWERTLENGMEIGWIGTGVMGASMAGHLLGAGHRLRVFTRTPSKAAGLLERGALWADSPAAAAEGADLAISIVGMPEDVEEVHLGARGTLAATSAPKVVVDMTTSSPALAVRIAEAAADRGVGAVDAPVSGGDVGAREARLSIMVGGADAAVAAARPAFECMGRTVVHQGPPGSGQHTKMVNQIAIASTMVGMCEGLRYAEDAGLDPKQVLESISGGAAGSWTLTNLAPRVLRSDLEPGFRIDHFLKDLRIALSEAERMNLDLPGVRLARELYEHAVAAGLAEKGTHALVDVVATRNGRPRA